MLVVAFPQSACSRRTVAAQPNVGACALELRWPREGIVIGCGRVGSTSRSGSPRDGWDVTVVDEKEEALSRLGETGGAGSSSATAWTRRCSRGRYRGRRRRRRRDRRRQHEPRRRPGRAEAVRRRLRRRPRARPGARGVLRVARPAHGLPDVDARSTPLTEAVRSCEIPQREAATLDVRHRRGRRQGRREPRAQADPHGARGDADRAAARPLRAARGGVRAPGAARATRRSSSCSSRPGSRGRPTSCRASPATTRTTSSSASSRARSTASQKVIARVNDPRNQPHFDLLGISPTVCATSSLLALVEHEVPGARARPPARAAQGEPRDRRGADRQATRRAPGKTVEQLALPEGSRLISVCATARPRSRTARPSSKPGDQVLAILQPGQGRRAPPVAAQEASGARRAERARTRTRRRRIALAVERKGSAAVDSPSRERARPRYRARARSASRAPLHRRAGRPDPRPSKGQA